MEEVLVFNSLAEAKNQTVNPGTLCFIKDGNLNPTRLTRTWKESEGSSLPKEIRENPQISRGHSRKSHKREGETLPSRKEKISLYWAPLLCCHAVDLRLNQPSASIPHHLCITSDEVFAIIQKIYFFPWFATASIIFFTSSGSPRK